MDDSTSGDSARTSRGPRARATLRPLATAESAVPTTNGSPRRLCSVEEAAEHLSVDVRFVRRLIAERRIRHVKVGRYVRFDRSDLDAFLAAGVREPLQR